jgi:hypothetical protein
MSAEYNPFADRRETANDAARDTFETDSAVETTSDTLFPATPVYARKRKSSGAARIALFAVPAVVILAGAAVMMAQPRSNDLFAETTAVPPAAPAAMPNPVTKVAQAPAMPAATTPAPALAKTEPAPVAREPAPRRVAQRAAPAPRPVADSPETWASDASARIPDAPMPYAPSAQTPAPAPVVTPPVAPPAENPAAPKAQTPAPESNEEPTT